MLRLSSDYYQSCHRHVLMINNYYLIIVPSRKSYKTTHTTSQKRFKHFEMSRKIKTGCILKIKYLLDLYLICNIKLLSVYKSWNRVLFTELRTKLLYHCNSCLIYCFISNLKATGIRYNRSLFIFERKGRGFES